MTVWLINIVRDVDIKEEKILLSLTYLYDKGLYKNRETIIILWTLKQKRSDSNKRKIRLGGIKKECLRKSVD